MGDVGEQKEHVPFSTREYITGKALEWMRSAGADVNPFNVVAALNALGYLRRTPGKPCDPRMISGEEPLQ